MILMTGFNFFSLPRPDPLLFTLRRKSTTGARRPRLIFRSSRLARREQEATPAREWMTMLALVEGHPNIDVIVFYALASAILAATLYLFHHRQME